MRLKASAPAFIHAMATPTRSGALGDSLTMRGFFVAFLTALTHSKAQSGSIPQAIPPAFTLGQLMLSSIMGTDVLSRSSAPFT